jgi:serine/threonine-protein kinase
METNYAGIHLETDRPVAIKLLLPRSLDDEDALRRFRREAHAVAHLNTRIDHQRVARTYDYGLLPDGAVYMAMELVAGQTLRDYIDKVHPVSIATAVRIARQAAEGLAAAHHCGVMHGDLEPSNIILTRDYYGRLEAKLIDFGFARLRRQLSAVNGEDAHAAAEIHDGTPPLYLAPEQSARYSPDERSDIYSLGVILYEMLTGRPPSAASLDQTDEEATPSPAESRGEVPEALALLVKHALCRKSSARLHSAAEFARQLRAIEDSLTHGSQAGPRAVASASSHIAPRPLNTPAALTDNGKAAAPAPPPPPVTAAVRARQDKPKRAHQDKPKIADANIPVVESPASPAPHVSVEPRTRHLQPVHLYALSFALALGITGGLWINNWSEPSSATQTPAVAVQVPAAGAHAAGPSADALSQPAEDPEQVSGDPSATAEGVSSVANPDEASAAGSAESEEAGAERVADGGDDATTQIRRENAPDAIPTRSAGSTAGVEAKAAAASERGTGGRCTLSTSESSLTIRSDGGSETITVSLAEASGPARVTANTPHWPDIVVFAETQAQADGGSVKYSIRSVSQRAGAYSVSFKSPCGSKTIPVTVK